MSGRGLGKSTCSGTSGRIVFLVASVTKPLTGLAAVILVGRGRRTQRRVCDIVPEFERRGKNQVRIVYLLTHTSGLPDMSENENLRREHAPLALLVEHGMSLRPPVSIGHPGQISEYEQAISREVVERLSGLSCAVFTTQSGPPSLKRGQRRAGQSDGASGELVRIPIARQALSLRRSCPRQ